MDRPTFGEKQTINTPVKLFSSDSKERRLSLAAGADGVIETIPCKIGQTVIAKARVLTYDATDGVTNYYEVTAVADNKAGTTALVGSVVQNTVIEEDAALNATFVANNTDDTLDLTVVTDAANAVIWWSEVEWRVAPVVLTA